MAKAQEPATEVDDNGDETTKAQPRRPRFGRGRKEAPTEVRTDKEWVDTLVAHEGGDDEPLAGSPFDTGDEDEEAPAPYTPPPELPEMPAEEPAHGELPPEASEAGDEVILRERQLYRPDKLALENQVRAAHRHRGEKDAFYEKSWTRRQPDSVEEIHNYIDNVIGTDLDPVKRRERLGRTGITGQRRQEMERIGSVQVEGLEEDLMIAFTFPKDEFRGARVVYETEGGYVVEVTRARGGDDARQETQYYTVSRIGEVAHVLDKMRAREAERRAREEGVAPVAPVEPLESSREDVAPLHEMPDEPSEEPPTPEEVGASPEDPAAPSHEERHDAPAPEETPAPQAAPEVTPREEDGDTEEDKGGLKGLGGLFKRKKGDDDPADQPESATMPSETEGGDDDKKGRFGLFKRGKKGDEDDAASGSESDEKQS